MDEPICDLCGQVITEAEATAGDYVATTFGEWHDHCIELYERDRDCRAAAYATDAVRDQALDRKASSVPIGTATGRYQALH